MDAPSSKVSKKPLRRRLKDLAASCVVFAVMLSLLWWMCAMAVAFVVDGSAWVVGYARTGKLKSDRAEIERRIARIQRALLKVEASRRSPRGKRAAREELDEDLTRARARLAKEDTYKPLPPPLDGWAQKAVSYGPWLLLAALIVWTKKTSADSDRQIRAHEASRAAEAKARAQESERRRAEYEAKRAKEASRYASHRREASPIRTLSTEHDEQRHSDGSAETSRIRNPSADEAEQPPVDGEASRPHYSGCMRPILPATTSTGQGQRDARPPSDEERRRNVRRELELARGDAIAKNPNMPSATDALPEVVTDDEQHDSWPDSDLSHAQWHASTDARVVITHAINRIPRKHLCLVLAELAEQLWPYFHEKSPNDWRPAWCLATLRAWCFGEASLDDLRAAQAEARKVSVRGGPGDNAFAALEALKAMLTTTSYGCLELEEDEDLYATGAIDIFCAVAAVKHHAVTKAATEAFEFKAFANFHNRTVACEQLTRPMDRQSFEELAVFLRARIAWPARASERWVVRRGTVKSGDSTLVVDGWRIVEVRAFTPERRGRIQFAN